MSRSLRDAALLARHGLSAVGPSLVLALLAFVTVGAVALAPRLSDAAAASELRYDIGNLDPTQRDVQTSNSVSLLPPQNPTTGEFGSATEMYQDLDQALAATEAQALPELEQLLGPPDYMARSARPSEAPSRDAAKNGPGYHLDYAIDPNLANRVTLVTGAAPVTAADPHAPEQVWMSEESATDMAWDVGETRDVFAGGTGGPPEITQVVLTGTFEATDPDAPYWQHVPGILTPRLVPEGNSPRQYFAVAYLAPDQWAAPNGGPIGGMTLDAWFPLDASSLDMASAQTVLPELRAFVARSYQLVPNSPFVGGQPSTFSSGTIGALDTAISRVGAMNAVLAVIAAAPLGVVLAVFALAVGAVIERRRAALSLAAARGASAVQTRGAMALEGVLAGTVPGAVATTLVAVLVPGSGWQALIPPALVALAPVVMFAAAPGARGLRTRRSDLGSRARSVVRVVAEIAVTVLAIAATVLLLLRGERNTNVFDPLLLAAPLLVSLAVCALLLRLFPLPMRALESMLHRGRGIVGFVGSARAVRDPALGAVGTVTVVLAVAVAVFSAGLLSTVDAAAHASARQVTGGGDAIAVSASFSDDQRQAIAAVPGVTAVAGVLDQGRVNFTGWTASGATDLVEADLTVLAAIRGDLPASGLDAKQGDAVPVVASQSFVAGMSGPVSLNGVPLVVVGTLPDDPGLHIHSTQWVMVDSSLASELTPNGFTPDTLILGADDSAPGLLDAVKTAGSAAAVRGVEEQLQDATGAPAVSALRMLLTAAAIGVGALAALAIILASLLAGPARERVIGALRTLGATRRIVGSLVVWELAPSVIAALVAGAVLGIGLPFIVVAGVDLAPFTGGLAVPLPREDPVVIFIVLAVVLVVAALASAIAAAVTLRRSPAATISIGAD